MDGSTPQNTINYVIEQMDRYESGNMALNEIAPFFQLLFDTGIIYRLNGKYAKTALELINEGACTWPETRRYNA